MTIECPDCGNTFRGDKCKCGYTPSSPTNKAEIERKWREMRRTQDAAAIDSEERWRAKAAVLATVKATGPLKWAHEIVALHEAGLYQSHSGYEKARAAITDKVAA